jgi:hypothetical protein
MVQTKDVEHEYEGFVQQNYNCILVTAIYMNIYSI